MLAPGYAHRNRERNTAYRRNRRRRRRPSPTNDVTLKGARPSRALGSLRSRLFHSGEHPTLRLRTREGFELTGTENHPVLCLVDMVGVPASLVEALGRVVAGDRVLLLRTPQHRRNRNHRTRCGRRRFARRVRIEGWASESRPDSTTLTPSSSRLFFRHMSSSSVEPLCLQAQIASGSTLHELDVQNLSASKDSPLSEMLGSGRRRSASRVGLAWAARLQAGLPPRAVRGRWLDVAPPAQTRSRFRTRRTAIGSRGRATVVVGVRRGVEAVPLREGEIKGRDLEFVARRACSHTTSVSTDASRPKLLVCSAAFPESSAP